MSEEAVSPQGPDVQTKPKFLAFEDEVGCHHILVMKYISGLIVSMAPDNVHVSAVFLAAGGPNIIVPCGDSVRLANALVGSVRGALAKECEEDATALSLNKTRAFMVKAGINTPELVVPEVTIN